MDGRNKKASSLTSELFGSKEDPSSSSSSAIFRSIFPPASKVMVGRESIGQETVAATVWNDKSSKTGDVGRNTERQENIDSVDQDQSVQPCHLSSSIYYGGPDVYVQSQNSNINSSKNKKDGGEDDSGSASRGNWWQGSLYY